MRIDMKAAALTCGLMWSGVMLMTGALNLAWDGYGDQLLQVTASIYPGFEGGSLGQVLLGTCYGFFDGAILGLFVALSYNWLSGLFGRPAELT